MNSTFDKELSSSIFSWLINTKYWLGFLAAKSNIIYILDEDLEIYWYASYARIRVRIKARSDKNLDFLMASIGNDNFDLLLPKDIVIKDYYKEIEAEIKRFFPMIGLANTWAICEAGESEDCRKKYGYFDICQKMDKQMVCSNCRKNREQEKIKYKGYIYLIGNKEMGIYKIGMSQQPKERYKAFQTKLPFEVKIIHQIGVDDMTKAEKRLHNYFNQKKTHGEWFQLDEQEVTLILRAKEFIEDNFFTTENEQMTF